jgi:hypothetical protein
MPQSKLMITQHIVSCAACLGLTLYLVCKQLCHAIDDLARITILSSIGTSPDELLRRTLLRST